MSKKVLKVYHYPSCSSCKSALKFLRGNGIAFDAIDIVQTPPSKAELQKVLAETKASGGSLKNLFNTSGAVYKEMGLSEKWPTLSEAERMSLLAQHGKLVKRPFVVSDHFCAVGFKPEIWAEKLKE